MTAKKTKSTPKDTELKTELTELNTETGTELGTELPPENTELNSFISESEGKSDANAAPETAENIEKITVAAARVMVANGLTGLLAGASQLLQADLSLTQAEVTSFAGDMAPLIVKYGNQIEEMPPWLRSLMRYKIELIALKGVCMLGVSLYFKHKLAMAQLELQKQQLEEAQRAAAEKIPEAA